MAVSIRKIAFLTMEEQGDYVTDHHLAIKPLERLGWNVTVIAWRTHAKWSQFDVVYICAPWDYPQHVDEFRGVLSAIDASGAVLYNDLSVVDWNLEKTYLRDVEARGDAIVPSTWYDGFSEGDVPGFFIEHNADRVVIKPTIGANAMDTFVLQHPVDDEMLGKLKALYVGRRFLVQPFIENIQAEGEFSLFFFNGEYSHAIRKTPKDGDFRVQEEHGADIQAVEPPEELLAIAHTVFSHIEPLPVYGRGDWVRGPDGQFLLMELELIEPSLYLRTDRDAATRFARALDQRFQELAGK